MSQGQRSRSQFKSQGQFSGVQRSILGAWLCLTSAAKSNNHNCGAKKSRYQSKVFDCVSVMSGYMRIIARMRSIGF